MMRMRKLPANNAWAFLFGDRVVKLADEERFFQTKKAALAAAERRGLKVDERGSVSVKQPPNKGAKKFNNWSTQHGA